MPDVVTWRKKIDGTYTGICVVFVIALVVMAGGRLLGLWSSHDTGNTIARVHGWPKVTGAVLDARIIPRDPSEPLKTSATGHLRYAHPCGEKTVSFHVAAPPRYVVDWQGALKPGGQVSIRYNPENPEELSFIDFTGYP